MSRLAWCLLGGGLLLAAPIPFVRNWLAVGKFVGTAWRHPDCSLRQASSLGYDLIFEMPKRDARAWQGLRELRKEGQLEEWSTPLGKVWIPAGNGGSLAYLMTEYQRGSYRDDNRQVVRKGDVVLDCGANVGTYTLEALHAGARLVVAIDPVPANAQALRKTFAREIAQGSVVVVEKGVWDKRQTTKMTFTAANTENSTVVLHDELTSQAKKDAMRTETLDIELIPIDDLVQELNLPPVTMIKMDIEGAERYALRGAKATLAKHQPRLAIAGYHLADDPEVLSSIIRLANPRYRQSPCSCFWAFRRIMPETLIFDAR